MPNGFSFLASLISSRSGCPPLRLTRRPDQQPTNSSRLLSQTISVLLRLLFHLFQFLLQKHLLLLLAQLGKQERKLQPHAPGRSSWRMDGVAIKLRTDIHWLESELHDSSHAAAEWRHPSTAVADFPVRGDDWLRGQVPAFFHVVVDEVLQQHLIDRRTAARTSDRPDVVGEHAQHEMAGHGQGHNVGSDAKLALSQVLAGGSRQLKDRSYAPDQLVRFARREQEGGLHVAQAVDATLRRGSHRREWLIDDGSNPANDHVPVVVNFHWNHRLDVQHILRAVSGIDAEVVVVLHGNADEAGDGILRGLPQRIRIYRRRWRCLGGDRSSLRANGSVLGKQRRDYEEKCH